MSRFNFTLTGSITPVWAEVNMDWITLVAKAWLTSAACTVTGVAPISSAMRAVTLL